MAVAARPTPEQVAERNRLKELQIQQVNESKLCVLKKFLNGELSPRSVDTVIVLMKQTEFTEWAKDKISLTEITVKLEKQVTEPVITVQEEFEEEDGE